MITYFSVIGIILIVIFGSIATYVTYKRAIELGLEFPKIISAIMFFVVVVIISFLTQDGLGDFLSKTIFTKPDSKIDVFSLSIFLLISGLYFTLLVITEDLLKNIDLLLKLFQKKKR